MIGQEIKKYKSDDYRTLTNKITQTSSFIDKLSRIEGEMCECIELDKLDVRVKDILTKCIDDINSIYMNIAPLETRLDVMDNDIVIDITQDVNNGTQQEELI